MTAIVVEKRRREHCRAKKWRRRIKRSGERVLRGRLKGHGCCVKVVGKGGERDTTCAPFPFINTAMGIDMRTLMK